MTFIGYAVQSQGVAPCPSSCFLLLLSCPVRCYNHSPRTPTPFSTYPAVAVHFIQALCRPASPIRSTSPGTISINTATGVVDSDTLEINEVLLVQEPLQGIDQYERETYGGFDAPMTQGSNYVIFTNGHDDQIGLYFSGSSLVGYTGGSLRSSFFYPNSGDFYPYPLQLDFGAGAITASTTAPPVVATTPELSSLALLGSGVIGIAGLVRRRFVA